MNRDGHNNVAFFIGPEVEHTPAFSKKTLFVVGKQDAATIERIAREHKTPHIFMGANHSFGYMNPGDNTYWDKTITTLLDKGFWVTLDYQAHFHDVVLEMLNAGIWQSRLFVPLLSVRIPNVQTSSVNLTIKIDDIDFKATNPGVWCLNHHEVTDSNRFTDWVEYETDLVLNEDQVAPQAGPAHTPQLRVPVYADVKNPLDLSKLTALEQNALRDPDVLGGFNTVKNETELGLDIEGKSKLKPDPDAIQETNKDITLPTTPELAAEAYAEGAKEDPLGKTAPKKTKVGKKTEA